MKIVKVIKDYKAQYLDPIELNVGDRVILGEEEKDDKWIGWIWAESVNNKKSGWIPMQIIDFSSDRKSGTILQYYTAKELTVNYNDEVELIQGLNGWYWVKNCKTDEEGWIPSEVISL